MAVQNLDVTVFIENSEYDVELASHEKNGVKVMLLCVVDVLTKKVRFVVSSSKDGSISIETIEEATEIFNLYID